MRVSCSGRRPGFTLIELMVAMTLTLFVMVILTQAFVTSLAAFSSLKSIGELQANLRTVSSLLQADLACDHFEGKRRLSGPDLLTVPPRQGFFFISQGSQSTVSLTPYLASGNGPVGCVNEGMETGLSAHGLQSWRACNHVLYFTIRLRGNRPESFMTAPVPSASAVPGGLLGTTATTSLIDATTFFSQPLDALYLQPGNMQPGNGTTNFFTSQWAEVCWFLVQTGSTVEPNNPRATTGTPVFSLYRAQYLPVMNPAGLPSSAGLSVPWPPASTPYPYANISSRVNNPATPTASLVFSAPDDLASKPANRTLTVTAAPPLISLPGIGSQTFLPYPVRASDAAATVPLPLGAAVGPLGTALGTPSGATLVLSNVTSFQVQVFAQPAGNFVPPPGAPIGDFCDLYDLQSFGNGPAVYDTSGAWTNNFGVGGAWTGSAFAPFSPTSPAPYSIQAIKVTIRIWDPASQMSRQVTVIQDM